jgi:hypothetical protein
VYQLSSSDLNSYYLHSIRSLALTTSHEHASSSDIAVQQFVSRLYYAIIIEHNGVGGDNRIMELESMDERTVCLKLRS